MSTFSKLWIKLRDKAYRHVFVATQLKRGIPFQFRAMRKKLGLSQADLAHLAGVSQGVISRAEDPDYGNLTFNTVLRISAGMDCAFVGRIVPFSDLARWFDNLSEESVQVPTFEEEDRSLEGLGTTFDIQTIYAPTVAHQNVFTSDERQVSVAYNMVWTPVTPAPNVDKVVDLLGYKAARRSGAESILMEFYANRRTDNAGTNTDVRTQAHR